MKLEIGMIARTNKGLLIDIIHDFDSELCAYKRDEITKASFNIIDLIEVGDYVKTNDEEIIKIFRIVEAEDNIDTQERCFNENWNYSGVIKQYDIKEILTHEQYEANCYKVGE